MLWLLESMYECLSADYDSRATIMTGSGSHPPLAHLPLAEAVFEIRFPPKKQFGVLPGRMLDRLGGSFPQDEEQPLAQVPAEMGPPHAPRHRFVSEDGGRMCQLGTGMVSLNHTTYVGYDLFQEDSRRIAEIAKDLDLVGTVDRLGLRYINRIQIDRPWEEIITTRVAAPEILEDWATSHTFRWGTRRDNLGTLTTAISWPVDHDGKEHIVIDLDMYQEPSRPMETEAIMDWHRQAHEGIYQTFTACLTEPFFSFLKGD